MAIDFNIQHQDGKYILSTNFYAYEFTKILEQLATFDISTETWKVPESNIKQVKSILTMLNDISIDDILSSENYLETLKKLGATIEIEKFLDDHQSFLYDYQREAVSLIVNNSSFLLADDMGLGKSVTTLSAIQYLIKYKDFKKVLIFCQKRAVPQWIKYAEKFTPDMDIVPILGTPTKRKELWKSNHDVLITNLEKILNDLVHALETEWDLIVIDEASYYIKNPESQRSKKVFRLKGKNRLALTGTPIENSLVDLFSLFKFLNPELFGSYGQFEKQYVVYIWQKTIKPRYKKGKEMTFDPMQVKKTVGYKNVDNLKKTIAPYFIRRTADDVGVALPQVIMEPFVIPMLDKQRKLYDEVVNKVKDSDNINADYNRIKIQRAYDHSVFVDENTNSSNKIEALEGLLYENRHRKTIVFSMWAGMIEHIHYTLKDIPHAIVVGSGSKGRFQLNLKDEEEFEKFEGDVNILLATDAISRSQDLPHASVVINVDIPWNPAVLRQRIMRPRRVSSTHKTIFAFNLISEKSLEETVWKKLQSKMDLAKFVIDENEYVVKNEFKLSELLR